MELYSFDLSSQYMEKVEYIVHVKAVTSVLESKDDHLHKHFFSYTYLFVVCKFHLAKKKKII